MSTLRALTEAEAIGADQRRSGERPPIDLAGFGHHEARPQQASAAASSTGPVPGTDGKSPIRILPARQFADIERPGEEPLVGEEGDMLLPEGGDLILYGDGGASKTTLSIDFACHMAAGETWLGAFPVPRPLRVALVEAEGPQSPFAAKLGRKLDSWSGEALDDRLVVLDEPWADFDFRRDLDIAVELGRLEVDVLIVGPIATVGMVGNGTIAEVRDFMAAVDRFRKASGRPLGMVLIHHENGARRVSGAFEGACDTLIQAEVSTPGKTSLWFEKCRWSSTWHKQRRRLGWTEGEGFEVVNREDRDLLADIEDHLRAHPWSKTEDVKEAMKPRRGKDVSDLLEVHRGTRFQMVTGAEARARGARSSITKLWAVTTDA